MIILEERICKLKSCGKKFTPHISNVKLGNGKFCSRKCFGVYRHLKSIKLKICKVCGAPFKGPEKRIMCSKKCGTKWMIKFRKKRKTYSGKIIIRSLKDEEVNIIRSIRDMPEVIPKIIEMLDARKTAVAAFGPYINKKVVKK